MAGFCWSLQGNCSKPKMTKAFKLNVCYELTMVIIQWSHEKGRLFLGVGWHWRGVPLDVHEF